VIPLEISEARFDCQDQKRKQAFSIAVMGAGMRNEELQAHMIRGIATGRRATINLFCLRFLAQDRFAAEIIASDSTPEPGRARAYVTWSEGPHERHLCGFHWASTIPRAPQG
jgi:hypothetical protein